MPGLTLDKEKYRRNRGRWILSWRDSSSQREKGTGYAIGSMANDAFFACEIAGDTSNAERFDARNVIFYGRSVLGRITR